MIVAVLVIGDPHKLLTTTDIVPVVNVVAKCTDMVFVPAPEMIVAPVGTVHT